MILGSPILIAGVGNMLLSDDGLGEHAVRELQKEPIPGVVMADIGTAILHGLSFLEKAKRVLIVDAVKGGEQPGTIYLFETSQAVESGPMVSIHAMGLREAFRLLSPNKPFPAITVLGVEPETLGFGMSLSDTVKAVLPKVVSLARQTVAEWVRELGDKVPNLPQPSRHQSSSVT